MTFVEIIIPQAPKVIIETPDVYHVVLETPPAVIIEVNGLFVSTFIDDLKVYNEVPEGLINASNATFKAVNIFRPETLQVYNGRLKMIVDEDYQIIANNKIAFFESPLPGEIIYFNYKKQ